MLPAIFGLAGPTLTADERAFFADAEASSYYGGPLAEDRA